MNLPLTIMTATAAIGAVDVLYFHLYRFRLFAQPGSVAEEITHLCRHAIFLTLLLVLSSGGRSPERDALVFALIGLDLLNGATDVLLERGSRAPLGGLPPLESLVHFLSSFGMGLAVAAYVLAADAPAAGRRARLAGVGDVRIRRGRLRPGNLPVRAGASRPPAGHRIRVRNSVIGGQS